jgi:HlyD family secretion protein
VGQIRRGQKVSFKVDAFPRDTFFGTVSQVRMNSTVVQNVVTYDTIVDFDNPELKLFPGMTAYVTIPVAAAANAVKVPNGALRYKPDLSADEIRALYQQYGIPEGGGGQQTQNAAARDKGARPQAARAGSPANTSAAGRVGTKPPSAAISDSAGLRYDTQVVWKLLPDKSLQPVRIRTGITDHTFTELVEELNGDLKAGDDLVTGVAQGRASGSAPRPGGPGVPRGR